MTRFDSEVDDYGFPRWIVNITDDQFVVERTTSDGGLLKSSVSMDQFIVNSKEK